MQTKYYNKASETACLLTWCQKYQQPNDLHWKIEDWTGKETKETKPPHGEEQKAKHQHIIKVAKHLHS